MAPTAWTAESWLRFYRGLGHILASRGYVALMPHYLERTDTKVADGKEIVKNFVDWSKAIADAVTYASKHVLAANGTTVPEQHHDVVLLGAAAYACLAFQVPTNDLFRY